MFSLTLIIVLAKLIAEEFAAIVFRHLHRRDPIRATVTDIIALVHYFDSVFNTTLDWTPVLRLALQIETLVAIFLIGIAPDIHVHVLGTLLDNCTALLSRLNHECFRSFDASGRSEFLPNWRENVYRLIACVESWEGCGVQNEHGDWSKEAHDCRR
jgi:hypothetical protein